MKITYKAIRTNPPEGTSAIAVMAVNGGFYIPNGRTESIPSFIFKDMENMGINLDKHRMGITRILIECEKNDPLLCDWYK